MKKQLLFATLATFFATSAIAQIQIGTGPLPYFNIPADFTIDNQSKLLTEEEGVFRIYDNSLTMIHQLTIPSSDLSPFQIIDMDDIHGRDYDYGLFLTQTLFNNDENYEYVVINGYSDESWRGASIVSENGTTIWSWQPSGDNWGVTYFIKWNNLYYICTSEETSYDPETDQSTIINTWYRIDRPTQSITRIEGDLPINVFPTIADRSQTITVELGEGNNATEVQVINALGQVVKTVPVQSGQREVQLRANDLNGGMHIIGTRTHEGQGACKIIIK